MGRCDPTLPELSTTRTRSISSLHGGGARGGDGGVDLLIPRHLCRDLDGLRGKIAAVDDRELIAARRDIGGRPEGDRVGVGRVSVVVSLDPGDEGRLIRLVNRHAAHLDELREGEPQPLCSAAARARCPGLDRIRTGRRAVRCSGCVASVVAACCHAR
eukprot:1178226-Prymnesium_polylepis.1